MAWRLTRRGIGAAAAALAACAAGISQEVPVFRTDVRLVRVVATVKTQAGELVGSLSKEDFDILDNGVRQEIAVFERQTEQPLSVALLVDTSGSTGKDLKYEIDSAGRFLRALLAPGDGRDAASLYAVNADVVQLCGFTSSYARLEQEFKRFRPEGASAVFQAIHWASQDLENREGRKVIVFITDGDDTFSRVSAPQALEAAQMADAVIYPIVVVPITNPAGRNTGGENALIYLAQGTGGKVFLPTVGPALDKAFSDIIAELRTQYMLAYYPRGIPPSKNRFHRLEVKVTRPDLRVSAPNGYYGDFEAGPGAADARISVVPDNATTLPDKAKTPPAKTKKR